MAYVTTTQLRDRLGVTLYARLTDRVAGATASDSVAQQIIDEASGEADSYLARRYATPIDTALHPELSDVLEGRVLDLAEQRAWAGSPFSAGIPARVTAAREAAAAWLIAVANGAADLPGAAPPASRTAADDGPRYSSSERIFVRDELDGL